MSRGDYADFRSTPAACDPNLPAAQCLEWHIKPYLDRPEVYMGDPEKGFGPGYSARCPAHDDGHPSFTVNVGLRALWYQCHAGCDQLATRIALIGKGAPPRCLVVPKERSAHLVDLLDEVLTSPDIEDGHKVLLVLAYVRGMAGLPRGNALEGLAGDTNTVSRASAFRYRKLGFQPTSGSYSRNQEQIKDRRSHRRVDQPEKSHGEISSNGETSKSLTVRPDLPPAA